jgi:hypothetical protein
MLEPMFRIDKTFIELFSAGIREISSPAIGFDAP